jgi:hypothetical protein
MTGSSSRRHRHLRALWRCEQGRVSAFVAVLTSGILAMTGLTLDGGLALAAKIKANGQAEAAARAGAQAIDLAAYRTNGELQLLPTQAITQAQHHLTRVGASGVVTVTGDTVRVAVTASHRTQLLGLVGISTVTVHATASAHPQRGPAGVRP